MIHIYTGNGKGKTTAALGLMLRALGADKKVALIQFMKKNNFSEHKAIKKYKLPIDIFTFGIGYYKILGDKKPKKEHQKAAQKALKKTFDILNSKKYDLVILDEINVAISFKLLDVNEIYNLLHPTPCTLHPDIILTGRHAHPKLIKMADLVTEMKERKHYFKKGIKAQKGIEY